MPQESWVSASNSGELQTNFPPGWHTAAVIIQRGPQSDWAADWPAQCPHRAGLQQHLIWRTWVQGENSACVINMHFTRFTSANKVFCARLFWFHVTFLQIVWNVQIIWAVFSSHTWYVCVGVWVSGGFLNGGGLGWGGDEKRGTDRDRKTKWGEFVCVFFTRSGVFIFCFFCFKAWAPNCKGNTND